MGLSLLRSFRSFGHSGGGSGDFRVGNSSSPSGLSFFFFEKGEKEKKKKKEFFHFPSPSSPQDLSFVPVPTWTVLNGQSTSPTMSWNLPRFTDSSFSSFFTSSSSSLFFLSLFLHCDQWDLDRQEQVMYSLIFPLGVCLDCEERKWVDGVLVKNMGSHTNEGASTKPLVTSHWKREKLHIQEGGMKVEK